MGIKDIAEKIFGKARETAQAVKRAITPTSGGPEYDELGETLYAPGAKVLFDAEHPKKKRNDER